MTAFALYRLPRENSFTLVAQTEGNPMKLMSLSELNGRSGFVVAPFAISPDHPLLLIRNNIVEHHGLSDTLELPCTILHQATDDSSHKTYAIDFANYHSRLLSGNFQKIVLARSSEILANSSCQPYELFKEACRRYPRMFICLVSTPISGTWLTATPEILLSGKDSSWHTMALAGTMKLEGSQLAFDTDTPQIDLNIAWTDKNIQEQRYVATYMTECLERFTTDFSECGPYTVRAGNLVHLRSDFRFSLPDECHLGDILQTLHPTPAVCGLPKHDAFKFICENEHTPRRYYSGFMGPLRMSETHLYVSLRCMQLLSNRYQLYAGGGLLSDSSEEQEWLETEAKMETMRNLIII